MIRPMTEQALFEGAEQVVAIVLGGGRGTRLYPLTRERAKPAVPLGGRYRLVDIPLSNCIHSSIKRIYVLTQFNSASLNRHISSSYRFDPFSRGFVEILAAEQTTESGGWYQGTADAVRQHLRTIKGQKAAHYLVLSGDQLYRMDYRVMLATHQQSEADITVAALPVQREAAKQFGIMKVAQDGRITEFVEKPQADEELAELVTPPDVFEYFGLEPQERDYLASMGVYMIKADVLEAILEDKTDWVDFGKHVIPKSLSSRRVYVHPFTGFWEDIGTVRSYYDTAMLLVAPDPPFTFYHPHFPIFTRARYLPGTRIAGAEIINSVICEGCTISGARISNSSIGIRTIVRRNVTIERSIAMGADFYEDTPTESHIPIGIGEGSHISQAIIDKDSRIGKNVVIQGSDGLEDTMGDGFVIRDGIVIVLKNAVIPDGTHIG